MSIAKGIERALERGQSIGCRTIQVFTKNNNQWRAAPLPDSSVRAFHALRSESGIGPIVAHTSYLINVASDRPELYEKSIASFHEELDRCETLGIEYLVVHPGAAVGAPRKQALQRVCKALKQLIRATRGYRVMICVETTAGQGSSLGTYFEEIGLILSRVGNPNRLGVCLDTCHIFAAGYDIRTSAGYYKTFRDFDTIIGLEHLKVIHVNDSKRPLNSRVDRHEHIGHGHIGERGFHHLMRDRRLRQLPKILETPKDADMTEDVTNLALLTRLYNTPLKK
jgi:deoxyribonuclease IV